MAQTWLREGTGGINVDMPVDTPNARAATETLREIQEWASLPPASRRAQSMCASTVRGIRAGRNPADLYLKNCGHRRPPCGLWPEDPRTVDLQQVYFENKPYYNFGCSASTTWRRWSTIRRTSRSHAQRRPPIRCSARRSSRSITEGNAATTYPEADKAKLSDVGK